MMQSDAEILNKRCTSDAVRFFIEHCCPNAIEIWQKQQSD